MTSRTTTYTEKQESISELRTKLDAKEVTPAELIESYTTRIDEHNPELNALIERYDEPVVPSDKENLPLAGIPIVVKDNMLVEGKRASAGSKMLENYTATYDATAVTRLKNAGAVILGRANMDEFAMGSSTEFSAYGPTKNPHDLTRSPGGSSGGSAAAVAAGFVPAALGSETACSIRQPASFCGVVGFKPSYGGVSRHGLIALGSSLDQIGPITTTVTDAETIFNVMKGHDPLDSTTLPNETWDTAPNVATKTVGVPWSVFDQKGVSPSVIENMKQSVEKLKGLGYEVKDIELPSLKYALSVYYIILPAEASANLARFDGVRYGLLKEGEDLLEDYEKTRGAGFGSEVKRRIMLGTYVLSSGYYDAYYRTARVVRKLIGRELKESFQSVDVIAMPPAPFPAFQLGEKVDDPLAMYFNDVFTAPATVTGIPALSVPSGTTEVDGLPAASSDTAQAGTQLPLGIQFMAPIAGEDRLFEIGKRFLGEKE